MAIFIIFNLFIHIAMFIIFNSYVEIPEGNPTPRGGAFGRLPFTRYDPWDPSRVVPSRGPMPR